MPLATVIDNAQYIVGWIAPLILERTAAIAVFDEPYGRVDVDGYACQGGRMGEHNVIIASLTKGVTEQAALAAARIRRACINVEFFLIVGIAGGVPKYIPSPGATPREIVLGDVVVSTPGPGHGGIHSYARGASKDVPGKSYGVFQVLTHNNGPDDRLLNTAKGLSETPEVDTRPREILQMMRGKLPDRIRSEYLDPEYGTNGAIRDRVFDTGYLHANEHLSCDDGKCDVGRSKLRDARGSEALRGQDTPWVHYGCIGVANQLQMSSFDRDRNCDGPYRVLAYEMETAGIIDQHPCLAIRGVCDYADGHKNKLWQRYAAATAAAYAKFLLEGLPLSEKAKIVGATLRKGAPPAYSA
jgi:nucleoside phosphorylase